MYHLRAGSSLVAAMMLFLAGGGLTLWGLHVLPWEPVRIGFIALVAVGCLIALRTVSREPHISRKPNTRARAAQYEERDYVAVPDANLRGMCWQCGSYVRSWNTVCWKCGASQPQPRRVLPPLIPESASDWDQSEATYRVPAPGVLPTDSAPIYRVEVPEGWSNPSLEAIELTPEMDAKAIWDALMPQGSPDPSIIDAPPLADVEPAVDGVSEASVEVVESSAGPVTQQANSDAAMPVTAQPEDPSLADALEEDLPPLSQPTLQAVRFGSPVQ